MTARAICVDCKLRIPTPVESDALRKIRRRDPDRFRILSARVCSCDTPPSSAEYQLQGGVPAKSEKKPSLDFYDRKD